MGAGVLNTVAKEGSYVSESDALYSLEIMKNIYPVESVTGHKVLKVYKKEGDIVRKDELIMEVEPDASN